MNKLKLIISFLQKKIHYYLTLRKINVGLKSGESESTIDDIWEEAKNDLKF